MEVKIVDYGFSEELEKNYITYKVTGVSSRDLAKLQMRMEDPLVIKCEELFFTIYYDPEYYPFHSDDAELRIEDYIAREEIEMTAYILDLLEEAD